MICSRYIPRAEMRRSAIQSFLCTSQHCYSHGVRTRSNTHLRDAELQSLSRAAVLKQSCFKLFSGDFYGMFCLQGSEEAIYMKVFVWKSYWCMFSPNSSAFFFFFFALCWAQSDLFIFVDVGGRRVPIALTAFLSMFFHYLFQRKRCVTLKTFLPECYF